MPDVRAVLGLRADSFLEYAFLRWVLAPAAVDGIRPHVEPQAEIAVGGHRYFVDYLIRGTTLAVAIELDGFQFHSSRNAFTYDRLRQNDLAAAGLGVVRFSYDAIRTDTARCIAQLQSVLRLDAGLAPLLVHAPIVERPEMDPDPLKAIAPSPTHTQTSATYFDEVRSRINVKTMRQCQFEAFTALANYFRGGGRRAACVMSV